MGRFKGRIGGWDVVNEALNDDGSLRQSEWMKIIGEDFLKAYQFAHEADPNLELYYNDFSLENAPNAPARSPWSRSCRLKASSSPVSACPRPLQDELAQTRRPR